MIIVPGVEKNSHQMSAKNQRESAGITVTIHGRTIVVVGVMLNLGNRRVAK